VYLKYWYLLAIPPKMVYNPCGGHDPQVENHCPQLNGIQVTINGSFETPANLSTTKRFLVS